jgi:hypothetical protein
VDLQVGHICRPDERGQIVDQNVVDYRFFTGSRDGIGLNPPRRERWGVFFVKILAIDSVRESLHRDRPVLEVRQNIAANSSVIVDDLAFGESNPGVHDLIEI